MTRRGTCWKRAGDGNKIYEYDALNRLGGIRSGAGVWKNRYDGESLRYETEENDKVTRFVFDRGELASEESGDGGIRYIHGDDRVLCSEQENMGMGYHIRDEAGSTLFILDRERNIRKSYRYDAFGRVLEERGDIENRLTYTGQMYDGGTGQYYLRARFYNPVTGRFLQEDVYRGDGLNLYAYCANNPVKYYDPSGYMSLCPGGKTFPGNGDGGKGTQNFDIVEYGDKNPGLENHHGVLDVWATNNIDGYKSRASKSTAIALTPDQHSATKSVYRDWLYERTGKKVGGKVDWTNVSPKEIQTLSEDMFNAANVPISARNNYYREFNSYIYGLGD